MSRLGKLAAFFALSVNLIIPPQAIAADYAEELYVPPRAPAGGISVWFSDTSYLNRAPTQLIGVDKNRGQHLCTTIASGECSALWSVNYSSQLPQCRSSDSVDCVKELYAVDESGKRIDATFVKQVPSEVSYPYVPDVAHGLVAGESSTIWKIPGISTITDTFAVVAYKGSAVYLDERTGKYPNFPFGEMQIAVYPVVRDENPGYDVNQIIIRDKNGDGIPDYDLIGLSKIPTSGCALTGKGECYLRKPFPEGIRFGVTMRLSQSPIGWVHGRMQDPSLAFTKVGSAYELNVTAGSVAVPEVGGSATADQIVPGLLQSNDAIGGTAAPSPSGQESIRTMRLWLKILGDKAVAMPREWFFRTLTQGEMQGADQCITNYQGLAGFVTTNSTTYSGGPPVFNKETQSLDYQVASPHYARDGSVFKGTYTLVMRADVARCLYKFSNAPIKATISVVSESGEDNSIATEAVVEKDGWFSLSANGFTFSSPTLRVKLSQEQPASAAPQTINKPVPIKKISITCKKGKVTKKVSGTQPTCPAGYKKI